MKRKLKSVWFNESENSVHHCTYEDDDDDDADSSNHTSSGNLTWFSIQDLHSFKIASIKRALKIRAEHLRNPRQSYSNTLVHVYLQCLNGGSPSTESVYKLSQLGLAHRRGLEFQSMEGSVRLERAKQRQHVRQAVVQEQMLTSSSGNSSEEIKQVSESLSSCAKMFARALAEADAMASGRAGSSLGSSSSSSSFENDEVDLVVDTTIQQKKHATTPTAPVTMIDALMITTDAVSQDAQEVTPPSLTNLLVTKNEDTSMLTSLCRNNTAEAEKSPILQRAVVALC